MKKWLPIFLIAILLAKPALADENDKTDETIRETEDQTTDPDTPDSNNDTNIDNTEPGTEVPDNNTEPETPDSNPQPDYFEPYEEPYEVPYEEPIEEPVIEEREATIIEPPTETPVQIDMIETESYAIFGKVVVDGKEKSDVEVTLKGEQEQEVKTDKDGTFSFKDLAPGTYEIVPIYKESKETIKPIEVTISDRDKIDIDFAIESETKKEENKAHTTAVKDIEREEDTGLPLYLKWLIVIGSLLVPVSVILYFVFRKV